MDAGAHGAAAWCDAVWTRVRGPGAWSAAQERAVLEPYRYLDEHPGKEIRSRLIDAFQIWLQLPHDALHRVTEVVRRLHTASLLVDDVEDNSTLRRGVPTAHTIYGVPQTINAANYVYFEVFGLLTQPGTHAMVVEELVRLHRGQGMDLYWRENLVCPTEEEYIDMVLNKTGGLFRIALQLMSASSTSPAPDLVPLVNVIGLLFQIRDDYMNLQDAHLQAHKGFCEDLTEGKFSFPVVHAMHHGGACQLLPILRQRTTNIRTKQYAVQCMEQCGSFAYTRAVLARLHAQACGEVRRLEETLQAPNVPLLHILEALRVPAAPRGAACVPTAEAIP